MYEAGDFLKRKGRFIFSLKLTVSLSLVAIAAFCIYTRLPQCFDSQAAAVLTAAAVTMNDGEYKTEEVTSPKENIEYEEQTEPTEETKKITVSSTVKKERDKSDYYDSYAEHKGSQKYAVTEKTIGDDGTKVDLCYIKDNTGLDVDFKKLLNDELTFSVKSNSDSPQVLIYHTHTNEGYLDEDVDYFYSDYYSRTQNTDFNVVAVGEAITNVLNKNGIKTLHDKTVHDSAYKGAYDRSVQTVLSDMEEYKDIKVVIDIHRDALGTEKNKVKPVFEYNGKKGAQIMILAGCDPNGARNFTNWKNNLNFALKIQNTAEKLYPNMTRPLDFDYFAYNEYVCDGSLLIEIGADGNSIDEAIYSGELLGDVLSKVLKK